MQVFKVSDEVVVHGKTETDWKFIGWSWLVNRTVKQAPKYAIILAAKIVQTKWLHLKKG